MNDAKRSDLRSLIRAEGKTKTYRFRGKWMTQAQIAELLGLSLTSVRARIQDDTVLDTPRQHPRGPAARLYSFGGEQLTVAEICKRTGKSDSAIRARITGDRVLSDAELASPPDWCRPCRITFRGKTMTIPEWEATTGLPVYSRLSLGWSIERALTAPMRKGIAFRGKTLSISEWGKLMGIKQSAIRERLAEGWPLELALTQPSMNTQQRARIRHSIRRMVQLSTGGWSQTSATRPGTGGGQSQTISEL